MPWDRKQRQEAILREKVAIIILDRLSDPRLGFITVTNVELSKDKKIAKVFYTVLGTDAQVRMTARALADSRGRIQEMLAPSLNMRSMPELRFIFNETVQKESKLLDLISDVTTERVERAGPDEELEQGLVFGDPDEPGLLIFDFEALRAAVGQDIGQDSGEDAEAVGSEAPGGSAGEAPAEDGDESVRGSDADKPEPEPEPNTDGPDDCPDDSPGELPRTRGDPSP
jgi:ribosome-binding factor A